MGDDDLADQLELSLEGKMPWCPFVGHSIAQMIIKNIHNLIVGDMCETGTTYPSSINFTCSDKINGSLPKRSATSI